MFKCPFRQYSSLYRAVSHRQRERERREREGGRERGGEIDERIKIPAPTASTLGPCPTMLNKKKKLDGFNFSVI